MADDTMEALRAVPLFSNMSDKELQRVEAIAKQVQHADGKVVLEEDRSAVGFHLILSRNRRGVDRGHRRQHLVAGGLLRRDLAAGRQAAFGKRHRHDRAHDPCDPHVELQPALG